MILDGLICYMQKSLAKWVVNIYTHISTDPYRSFFVAIQTNHLITRNRVDVLGVVLKIPGS